ncbi:MAG TPA: DUF4388 domain-containing protein [Pyrinomonadaceae bacterium]|nr:DUF4388 domain-containing protein [Pyrinomonadaceae bacterium]
MHNSRFLVLTGHLNDYPLSDLVGILRHQHKTGRLLIEYPNGPASFFFNDGELIDAQIDKLSGLQALCVALAQPASSFNFNPLIRPTRRSIENSLQKAVSELLGCWSENDAETYELPPARTTPAQLPGASSASVEPSAVKPDALMMSALVAEPQAKGVNQPLFAIGAIGLLLLGISTVIAVTAGLGKNQPAVVSSAPPASEKVAGGNNLPAAQPIEPEPKNEPKVGRVVSKAAHVGRTIDLPARQSNDNASESKEAASSSTSIASPSTAKPAQEPHRGDTDRQSVKVVLQIESGRVAKASIANHRAGMEAYEAMALRIARQRRYPASGSSQETVTIKVSQPK